MDRSFSSYKNSFKLSDEWEDYGIGDPYVLRFNGRYYLYCSTKDFRKGVKVWSSEDLYNWKYQGLAADDEKTTGAYAPEVIYWNGYFYMYTSPAGKGHYVLKSENPTGPFVVQTENFGMSIDGSVFIDDDAKLYFTHAGFEGIVGHEMQDPLIVDPSSKTLKAYLGGWTEGSTIIKRNGMYYITYTGNHVFSKGYRVNYSIAKDSPLGEYVTPDNNPIIINTEENFNGLGHSSTVLGPDMDSYYIIYHNLVGRSQEGPPVREMNIDRIVFNGEIMNVLGPTNFTQPLPKRADCYGWLSNRSTSDKLIESCYKEYTSVLIDRETETNYTAEYNFHLKEQTDINKNSEIGAIFSYKSEKDFMFAVVKVEDKTLELYRVEDGCKKLIKADELPVNFDFTKLHAIRIEKNNRSVKVFFDYMLRIFALVEGLQGGKIGYIYNVLDPVLDFTAFDNDVNGSSDWNAVKPVPGKIEAVHFQKSNDLVHAPYKEVECSGNYRCDSDMSVDLDRDNSYFVRLSQNDSLNYNINVNENSLYGFDFIVRNHTETSKIEIYIDDLRIGCYKVLSENFKGQWSKINIGELELQNGYHNLKICMVRGTMELKQLEFYKLTLVEDILLKGWSCYGDIWNKEDMGRSITASSQVRIFTGRTDWRDYILDIDLKAEDAQDGSSFAILFRVTNESSFRHQVQDSFIGYRLRVNSVSAYLEKVNYDNKIIGKVDVSFESGEYKHIRVVALKSRIKVYLEDMGEAIFEYNDQKAFMCGKVGIEVNEMKVSFENARLSSIH